MFVHEFSVNRLISNVPGWDICYGEEMTEFYLFFKINFQAGITQNTVMHLAIFHVFPLQIVGILEINKRVCRLFAFNKIFQMCLQE